MLSVLTIKKKKKENKVTEIWPWEVLACLSPL